MGSRQTTAKINRSDTGSDFTLQHNETDAPLIQVDQMERLHKFRPDAVDWIMQQTQAEADFRRNELKRVNTILFAERLVGQLCALFIGVGAIMGGSYVAVHGQPWAGASIAGAAIGGLAIAFISGRAKRR